MTDAPAAEALDGDGERTVLLVTRSASRDVSPVFRSVALAHLVRARMRVLVVVTPDGRGASPLLPHAASRAVLDSALADRGAAECVDWLRSLSPDAEVVVRHGSLTAVAAQEGRASAPELIVIPRSDLDRPRDGAAVARASACATLIAAEAQPGRSVLAATDLRHPDLPVLNTASALATASEAPFVAMHNVTTAVLEPISITGMAGNTPTPAEIEARREALRDAVERVGGNAEPLLTSEPDTVGAMLAEARARDVEVVVVGTSSSSWVERLLFGSVADEVLDRARRSVLVVPLGRGAA